MAIAPYRTSTDVFSPLFESLLGGTSANSRMGALLRAPEADVVETESEIRVQIELPGMRAEEVNVDLENNVLTVNGEKKEERSEERGTYHLSERRYGKFSRSFVLPRDVDAEQIHARFDHGVLSVTIPKSERARRRRIQVSNGKANEGGEGRELKS